MITQSPFKAAWWCKNQHLQTLYPSLFRRQTIPRHTKTIFELDDGDFLELAISDDFKEDVCLVLHGLEGSLQSHYSGGLLQRLNRQDITTVFMHFRGCGDSPNRLAKSYHSGETADLTQVLEYIRNRYPNRQIMAIGFSLGGNVLLKYLGESGENSRIQKAIAVSVPFDLDAAATRLNVGASKIYRRHLLARLKATLFSKKDLLESQGIEVGAVDNYSTFHEFDDRITAPLHGFDGVADYYSKSSSRQFLHTIKKPTLIIHSTDDPFVPKNAIPEENELSDSVHLELSSQGGHVGFIGGAFPFFAHYWLDERISDFFCH